MLHTIEQYFHVQFSVPELEVHVAFWALFTLELCSGNSVYVAHVLDDILHLCVLGIVVSVPSYCANVGVPKGFACCSSKGKYEFTDSPPFYVYLYLYGLLFPILSTYGSVHHEDLNIDNIPTRLVCCTLLNWNSNACAVSNGITTADAFPVGFPFCTSREDLYLGHQIL